MASEHDRGFSTRWRRWRAEVDLDEYEQRWDRQAADGADVHGEADLVMTLEPSTALDAGCGMGRVGIELARRGVEVVGVDLDADLLDRARRRAPGITWVEGDLADVDLDSTFDVVVLAGNVLPFVKPERWSAVVANLGRHVEPGGRMVIGAMLDAASPTLADQDRWAADADLELERRLAGWDATDQLTAEPSRYAVSVYRRR